MDDATIRASSATSLDTVPRCSSTSNGNSNSEPGKRTKKVRLACERCRYRRIKCDGQTPACGNCTKSGSACIDVDSRNAERKVSRGFAENAVARIAWLEDIIRTQLPHINLNNGPHPNGRPPEVAGTPYWRNAERISTPRLLDEYTLHSSTSDLQYHSAATPMEPSYLQGIGTHRTFENHGLKRPLPSIHSRSNRESSVEQDTRSVALDLGLLSLNSDSRQLHYLGSSSGSLLASLVRTGSAHNSNFGGLRGTTSSPEIDDTIRAGYESSTNLNLVQFDVMRASINALYAQLRKDLPPRKDCDILCNQFFSQLHPNHPFLHRASFNWMIDALYICAATKPPFLLQHNGWPETVKAFDCNGEEHVSNGRKLVPVPVHVAAFQLFLVLSIGATLQIRRRLYHHDPETFFSSAMSLSNHVFNSISLPSLQAILVLLVHSLVGPSGNDIWTLAHLAMAHSIDLGIHREIGDSLKFSKVAVDMRRRIFFCVYTFDRSISTIQGRPFSIGDGFFDVNLPSMDPDPDEEIFTNGSNLSGNTNDHEYMNYSIHLFKMSRLVSRIKTLFYRLSEPSDGTPWSTNLPATQNQLRTDLEQWVSEVPSVVLFAPVELKLRLTMKLKIHYHGTMCLLHQPSQAIVQPSDQALQICYHHAAERLRLYETLYESGNLVHSWRTVHDMFLAGTTVMYCVWISAAVRENVSLPALASICRRCSSLLSVGGEWWPVIRKSKLSLERLASHTIEMFAEKSRSSESTSVTPSANSFRIDPARPIDTAEPFQGWMPENIEEALTSVLNHDHGGQLSNIFETPPNTAFPVGISDLNDGSNNFDEEFCEFWASFDGNMSNDIQG